MMRVIRYSADAYNDIVKLNDYIVQQCCAPLTAKRYLAGLEQRILWLKQNADLFPIVPELSFQLGSPIRRLNYERIAILYSMTDEVVYIHRIIPQSMIY